MASKEGPDLYKLSEGEEEDELTEEKLKTHAEACAPSEQGVEQEPGKPLSELGSRFSARTARSNASSRFRKQMEINRLKAEEDRLGAKEALHAARARRLAAELDMFWRHAQLLGAAASPHSNNNNKAKHHDQLLRRSQRPSNDNNSNKQQHSRQQHSRQQSSYDNHKQQRSSNNNSKQQRSSQ